MLRVVNELHIPKNYNIGFCHRCMATEQESAPPVREPRVDATALEPFHGFLSPGICFASGHCIWLLHMAKTPTSIGTYDEVWVITPEEQRILYVDPVEAGPYVETYHEFDRVVGGTITWERATTDEIMVHLDAEDGTTLDLEATLGPSTGTRLLQLVSALTPTPILRMSLGESISNLLFGLMMDANGLKVAGRTDTHEPYRVEPDTLRMVTGASAVLNHEDLGEVQPPDRLIGFGDAIVPDEAFVSFGELFLRPPSE